jgi:hypothetical protein
MSIWSLTLPNLVGYAVVGGLLFLAIAHAFAAWECRRVLTAAAGLGDHLPALGARKLCRVNLSTSHIRKQYSKRQNALYPHKSASPFFESVYAYCT